MEKFWQLFFAEDSGCACGCGSDHHHGHEEEEEFETATFVLVDEETGVEHEMELFDIFKHEDSEYCVVADLDDEENGFYVILKYEENEEGEEILTTLAEEEEDAVYAAYDELCAAYAEEDEE